MRYLRNTLFHETFGTPFIVDDPEADVPEHEGTVGEMLLLALSIYRPEPARHLSISELYLLNQTWRTLEEGHPVFFTFQDDEYKVLLKALRWVLPLAPWFRQAPAIMALLQGAGEEAPPPSIPVNGSQPESVAVS